MRYLMGVSWPSVTLAYIFSISADVEPYTLHEDRFLIGVTTIMPTYISYED